MVTYLVPVFAVLIGALALDERPNWHQPVGALIVLVGVAVTQGLPRRSRPAAATAGVSAVPAVDAAPTPGR
jgi:drug/metabolite transporter (DMT)-like permease